MGLSISSYSLWMLSIVLEACLCVLFFWRGANKRLPLFATYLVCQIVTSFAGRIADHEFGFWSSANYYISWVNSGTVMIAAWLVTAELCFRGFRAYKGIWAVTWRLLLLLSALLLSHAAYDMSKNAYRIGALILVLQRDLALASAVILIAILIIERRYQLELGLLERQIAIGLCVYFIAILLSNSLLIQWYMAHWPTFSGHPPSVEHLEAWWNGAKFAVLDAALAVWCFALRRPLPAPRPDPILLPPATYGELSPAINYRLRALNERLMDLLKA
ncbi:MAG: hypothetical protein ACLP1Y_08625 [Candidatus Acidiferrales bacterium]